MNHKKEKQKIIESAKKSLVELRKVAEQVIDLSELDPEKAKTAAAAKRLAVEDSFAILELIRLEQEKLDAGEKETDSTKKNEFFGIESRLNK